MDTTTNKEIRQGILKGLSVILALTISFSLIGCSSVNENINTENENAGQEEPMVGMPDPWREISEDEALQYPRMFVAPEGASNVVWRVLDSAADAKEGKEPLIELDFDIKDEYGSQSFTARYQYGAGEDDDRITKVGKVIRAARIDELPQLLNIVRGDMSIVGPRPERVEHVQIYSEMIPSNKIRERRG